MFRTAGLQLKRNASEYVLAISRGMKHEAAKISRAVPLFPAMETGAEIVSTYTALPICNRFIIIIIRSVFYRSRDMPLLGALVKV